MKAPTSWEEQAAHLVGKKDWERVHGARDHSPTFANAGWTWTPNPCACPGPGCVLDTSERTKKGRAYPYKKGNR